MKKVLACTKTITEEDNVARAALKIAERNDMELLLIKAGGTLEPADSALNSSYGVHVFADSLNESEAVGGPWHNVTLKVVNQNFEELQRDIDSKDFYLVVTDRSGPALPCIEQFRDLECPVLAIPPHINVGPCKKVAFITDLRYCDLGNFRTFLDLFEPFDAEILLIHATASGLPGISDRYVQELFSEEILRLVKPKEPGRIRLINLSSENTAYGLHNLTEIIHPEIMAIGNRNTSMYERLFNCDKYSTLYSDVPLLLFN